MKTVLITGGSSGFGLKMVKEYLAIGWKVLATVRNVPERKKLFTEEFEKYPGMLNLLELDIAKAEQIQEVIQYINDKEDNSIDVLVNNAGFGTYGALEDISIEQIRYQMEVNFIGPSILIKGLLPALRKSRGKVFNISSLMGRYSCPLASVYSASKYALEGLTEGLMYELKSFGVSVCSIQPGGHKTNFVTSVNWGEKSFGAKSPYQGKSDAFKNMLNTLAARKGAPGPEAVAETVVRLSQKKNIPRNVLVGLDASGVGVMQSLLPDFIYQFIMFNANKFIFKS